jgi:hypothetical protein
LDDPGRPRPEREECRAASPTGVLDRPAGSIAAHQGDGRRAKMDRFDIVTQRGS